MDVLENVPMHEEIRSQGGIAGHLLMAMKKFRITERPSKQP